MNDRFARILEAFHDSKIRGRVKARFAHVGKLMKRFLKITLYAIATLLILGCGAMVYWAWPRAQELLTDAETIRIPTDQAVVRDVVWQPAAPVGDVNSLGDDYEVEISADGGTMLLVRGRPGGNADIYVADRRGAAWSETKPLSIINTPEDELGPVLSQDGSSLYFYSDRPGGLGGYDLWVSRRGDTDWREPTNLGPAVNSSYDDYGPALTADGKTLYFASNRPKPDEKLADDSNAWSATLRADRHVRDFDLFACSLTASGAQAAIPLVAVNSPYDEGAPAVSPYGDFLYFASNRPGGLGGYDIYRSRRLNGSPGVPEGLGPTINTPMNELDPRLSLGGYGLYFSSDRGHNDTSSAAGDAGAMRAEVVESGGVTNDGAARSPDYDVYYSASREVFRELESRRSALDWAALWAAIGPNLAWALLALLLIALMLALMRDFKNRQLSLLARCLFASLIAHLVLLLLFNVWQVGSAVATAFRGRGDIKISLVSTAVGDTISTQIRGDVTEVAMPASASIDVVAAEFSPGPSPIESTRVDTSSMVTQTTPVETLSTPGEFAATDAAVSEPIEPPTRPIAAEPTVASDVADFEPELALPAESPGEHAEERAFSSAPASIQAEVIPARVAFATSQPASERVELVPVDAMVGAEIAGAESARAQLPARVEDAPISVAIEVPRMKVAPEAGIQSATAPLKSLALPKSSDPEANESAEMTKHATMPVEGDELAQPASLAMNAVFQGEADRENSVHLAPAQQTLTESLNADSTHFDSASDAPASSIVASAISPPLAATPMAASGPVEIEIRLPEGEKIPSTGQSEKEIVVVTAEKGVERPADALGVLSRPSEELSIVRANVRPEDSNLKESTIVARVSVDDATGDASKSAAATPSVSRKSEAVASSTAVIELALPSDADLVGGGALPPDAIGVIRGRVTQQNSGRPGVGARVRLVLPDHADVETKTDDAGDYSLFVPAVPEFFALSASLDGFVPRSVNVRAADLRKGPLVIDFKLEPVTDLVIALEDRPDVHHLGNDQFEGKINSQFQKESEGRIFLKSFQVAESQLSLSFSRAEIRLLAKGVQCPHQIRINGRLIRSRLDDSPRDGSFGEFVADVNPLWLLAGENTFKIRAQSCRGDLDDFEFVNIQIRLIP